MFLKYVWQHPQKAIITTYISNSAKIIFGFRGRRIRFQKRQFIKKLYYLIHTFRKSHECVSKNSKRLLNDMREGGLETEVILSIIYHTNVNISIIKHQQRRPFISPNTVCMSTICSWKSVGGEFVDGWHRQWCLMRPTNMGLAYSDARNEIAFNVN